MNNYNSLFLSGIICYLVKTGIFLLSRIQQRSKVIQDRFKSLKENCKLRRLELLASNKYQVVLQFMFWNVTA